VSIVLEQDCHRMSKVGQPQRLDVMSIDEYTPLRGIKYTSDELENCAFPGSIRANYDLTRNVDTERYQLYAPEDT
jgi:hypothetical protein